VIDARRGEPFAAAYSPSDRKATGELACSRALRPEDLHSVVEQAEHRGGGGGKRWLAVGDGAVPLSRGAGSGRRCRCARFLALHLVSAAAICDIGSRAEPVARYEQIVPDYRRRPDAEIARDVALARGTRPRRTGRGGEGRGAVTESSPAPLRAERSSALEIRRLLYTDLPEVIAIERRVFPTPWSLADVRARALQADRDLLAALSEQRLVGYLICSRYDTVWHVMNVAVDVDHQRMGLASRCWQSCICDVDDDDARFTHRGAPLQRYKPSTCTSVRAFAAAGSGPLLTRNNGEDALVIVANSRDAYWIRG